MKSDILKRLLKRLSDKLPAGVSVGFPWGISVDPRTLAQHVCKESTPDELDEIQRQLPDFRLCLRDSVGALQPELQAVGVRN